MLGCVEFSLSRFNYWEVRKTSNLQPNIVILCVNQQKPEAWEWNGQRLRTERKKYTKLRLNVHKTNTEISCGLRGDGDVAIQISKRPNKQRNKWKNHNKMPHLH